MKIEPDLTHGGNTYPCPLQTPDFRAKILDGTINAAFRLGEMRRLVAVVPNRGANIGRELLHSLNSRRIQGWRGTNCNALRYTGRPCPFQQRLDTVRPSLVLEMNVGIEIHTPSSPIECESIVRHLNSGRQVLLRFRVVQVMTKMINERSARLDPLQDLHALCNGQVGLMRAVPERIEDHHIHAAQRLLRFRRQDATIGHISQRPPITFETKAQRLLDSMHHGQGRNFYRADGERNGHLVILDPRPVEPGHLFGANVVENAEQIPEGLRRGVGRNHRTLNRIEPADVVESEDVIRVGMRKQHRVNSWNPGIHRLLAKVGRRVHHKVQAARLDVQACAAAPVALVRRRAYCAVAPDDRHTDRCARTKERDLHRLKVQTPAEGAQSENVVDAARVSILRLRPRFGSAGRRGPEERGFALPRDWIKNLSLNARGARYQIGIAIALITVIPALAITYLMLAEDPSGFSLVAHHPGVVAIACFSIALGYALLSRYPVNIIRLRRYLQDMVNGKLPDKVQLIEGMADIPAIENALQLLVGQLSRQLTRMQDELQRIEWLTRHDATPALWKYSAASDRSADVFTAKPDSGHVVLESVGEDMLTSIVGDLVELIETSAVCFERDGAIACRFLVSDWCRFLDGKSKENAGTSCSSICEDAMWRQGGLRCIETGQPTDVECPCGLHAFFAPIAADGRPAGALGFTHGDPPRAVADLARIADMLHAQPEELRRRAESYETRPIFIVNVSRERLLTAARLLGQIIDRKKTEETLRRSEEELRKHRDNLEHLVEERTVELKQTNQLLEKEIDERRKAERLKDEFVGTVSHELRTPLAITKEGISLLLDEIPGPVTEKQRKVLSTARSNIDRLARIINDLLDISKIEAGKMEIRRAAVDLATLVQHTVASMEPLAQHKGITLETRFGDFPHMVYADADRILQVLTNLVGNAIKFTSVGQVRISTSCRDRTIECSVEDTGAGISAEDLPKLFQKFVQLRRVEGAGERGTGLGLVIAKNIVELHRGRIWAESAGGKGTRFTFTVERYQPEALLRQTVEERIREARVTQKEILLALVRIGPEFPPKDSADVFARPDVMKRLESAALVRTHDFMAFRDERHVVLLALCAAGSREIVLSRWIERLHTALAACAPATPWAYGKALYPEDGFTPEELLGAAENDLALRSQSMTLQL